MKKLLLLLISLTFLGCSSINVGNTFSSLELDDAMSSDDETQRILALGLTHEENLKEASKLKIQNRDGVTTLFFFSERIHCKSKRPENRSWAVKPMA